MNNFSNGLNCTGKVLVGSGGTGASLDVQGPGQLNLPSGNDIVLGYNSTGTMNVSNSAIINFNFQNIVASGIVVGQNQEAEFKIAGSTANFANARVAQDNFLPAGTPSGGGGVVTLNSGGVFKAKTFTAGRNGSAVVNINPGGQLIVTGTTKLFDGFVPHADQPRRRHAADRQPRPLPATAHASTGPPARSSSPAR
jgi:hypothetical protein